MTSRRAPTRFFRALCVLAALCLCAACGRTAKPQPLWGSADPAITHPSR